MTERVELIIHGAAEIPQPYRDWVVARNRKIGEEIIAHSGAESCADGSPDTQFLIATRPMTIRELHETGVGSRFYGTAVTEISHTEKSILHTPLSRCHKAPPDFYTSIAKFADEAHRRNLVLPGTTVFSANDLMSGYQSFCTQHAVRTKLPNRSDGVGQYRLTNVGEVEALLDALEDAVFHEGVVLEPQLLNPKTISVGSAVIEGDTFSFIAHQKDEVITEYDSTVGATIERTRYTGARIILVKGDMGQLLGLRGMDENVSRAVHTSVGFWEQYSAIINPLSHRISFDFVFGREERCDGSAGKVIGGITDITARPGGTDPAIIEGVKAFDSHERARVVEAEVDLYYGEPKGTGAVYVASPGVLQIEAYATEVREEYTLL